MPITTATNAACPPLLRLITDPEPWATGVVVVVAGGAATADATVLSESTVAAAATAVWILTIFVPLGQVACAVHDPTLCGFGQLEDPHDGASQHLTYSMNGFSIERQTAAVRTTERGDIR